MAQVRRNEAYAIAQNEAELERLVSYARAWDAEARDGLARIGVGRGWKAIDVGCGPLGVLPVLAELVGSEGVVVGVDMDEPSLQRARMILDQQGLEWVRLAHANINEMAPSAVCPPGPFDVAFCRNVLTHQQDAAETLRRIAAIVRPGGYIVAQSQMGDSAPRPAPAVPALDRYGEWVIPLFERRGSRWVTRQYHRLCRAVGLEEVGQRGFFHAGADSQEIRARRDSLANWRAAIVEGGLASGDDVDAAIRQLDEAVGTEFEAVFSSLYVELIAQVPSA
jgi:ubiquinone/menaquinone biosynthesis C-methylase UbiE